MHKCLLLFCLCFLCISLDAHKTDSVQITVTSLKYDRYEVWDSEIWLENAQFSMTIHLNKSYSKEDHIYLNVWMDDDALYPSVIDITKYFLLGNEVDSFQYSLVCPLILIDEYIRLDISYNGSGERTFPAGAICALDYITDTELLTLITPVWSLESDKAKWYFDGRQFRILTPSSPHLSITAFDLTGKLIGRSTSGSPLLSTVGWPPGIYLIRVDNPPRPAVCTRIRLPVRK